MIATSTWRTSIAKFISTAIAAPAYVLDTPLDPNTSDRTNPASFFERCRMAISAKPSDGPYDHYYIGLP